MGYKYLDAFVLNLEESLGLDEKKQVLFKLGALVSLQLVEQRYIRLLSF